MEDLAQSDISLIPVNDCVLVKLEEQYNNFSTHEGKYDSRTHGIVVAIQDVSNIKYFPGNRQEVTMRDEHLLNKRVYWEEYKEGARIRKGNELFCFIKIEDIRGYEDV